MTRGLWLALAALCSPCFAQDTGPAADCPAQLQSHLASDLALGFEAFDQADTTGWRPLADNNCHAEAATLIAAYRERHPDAHPVLQWHQVQMQASAGQTDAAIAGAMKTLRPDDAEAKSPFKWNAYALGTVAFLRGDRAALEQQRAALAKAAEDEPANGPNVKSLSRLSQCFGQPYRVAYRCKV